MKKIQIIVLLLILSYNFFSQGLLNNSAQIVMNSTVQVLIDGNGNWTNNGIVIAGNSTVHFIGNVNQSILGANTTAFYNVTVNNIGGGVSVNVGRDISISNILQMTQGDFDLKDALVDLNYSGILNNEASTRRVKATDAGGSDGLGTGTIRAIRDNPVGNISNLGLTVNLTGIGVNIIRGHLVQPGTGTFAGNNSVFRYFQIDAPAIFAGTNVTFHDCYPQELNVHNPVELIMFQWVNGGGPDYWTPVIDYTGSNVPITKNLFGSTLTWTKVTLGSEIMPLPVELITFNGICNTKNNNVLIEWETLSEINNDYFVIEKSFDGISFTSIGTVSGNGNSNQTINYKYIDYSNGGYYRLKQIDYDGKTNTYNTIYVNCENNSLNLYPNPASSNESINISGTYQNIQITDILGRDIKANIVDNQIYGLPCGVYIVIIDGYYKTKLIVE